MANQQGMIYRYVRADADHDVSGDPLTLSLDGGTTWITTGVTYIATASLPAAVAAVNTARTPPAGMVGYWWRILTGPGTSFPLNRGPNTVTGRLTDNPETPYFAWRIVVDPAE